MTTGTIQGTVTDTNGAIVPGANVEIKNLDTNLSRTLTTDEGGRFVALALPPGPYSVTVFQAGLCYRGRGKTESNYRPGPESSGGYEDSGVEERVTITASRPSIQ